MTDPGLSVVMITFNRQEKIAQALESVKWAEEIIVLDSGSTDNTVDICRKYTNKIFLPPQEFIDRKCLGLNLIKNFGFGLATQEWVLSLDSDEVVTPALAEEIRRVVNSGSDYAGFFIPRKNYYWKKCVRSLSPDYQLRLFKKGFGNFAGEYVHEKLELSGKAGYLSEPLIHYNYDSVGDFLMRLEYYLPDEVSRLKRFCAPKTILKLFTVPAGSFHYYFFKQKAYKDGAAGVIVSALHAYYHGRVYLRYFFSQ